MSAYNWSTFTVRIPVKASPAQLYQCWSTRAGMEYWFLRQCEYRKADGSFPDKDEPVQEGDSYTWLWHGWPDDTVEKGMILEANGKDLFRFSFGEAGNCTVRIIFASGVPLVELTQDSIPDDEEGKQYWHLGCKTGWTFYLTNLKSLLEGGIDLRNRDPELHNVVNS